MEKGKEVAKVNQNSNLGVWANPDQFGEWQRMAIALSSSHLVPKDYKGKDGVASCLIALNMASRMQVDPLMLMQNMDIIHGKPSLSSKFLIAQINNAGKFSPIRFEVVELGTKEFNFQVQGYDKQWKPKKEKLDNFKCRAYCTDLKTEEVLQGEWITLTMAIKEKWYGKWGSKWPIMPNQMAKYRAASFWSNIFFPEGKLGMPTKEDSFDSIEIVEVNTTINDLNEKGGAPTVIVDDGIEDAVIVEEPATDATGPGTEGTDNEGEPATDATAATVIEPKQEDLI